MLYTIGDPRIYEPAFDLYGYNMKASGGTIWIDREDAEIHALESGFRVYGVLASEFTDIEPSVEVDGAFDLRFPCLMVRLHNYE